MASEGPAITNLVPLNEMAPGGAASIRTQIVQALLAQAAGEFRIPQERLVVRDINPDTDLDYGTGLWNENTGTSTGAYETMSTGTLADQRFVAIYGVRDNCSEKNVGLLKFNIGGGDRAVWSLENLGTEKGCRVGYSPSAVVIPPNAPYTISRWVLQASVSAYIVLKGVVVEPRGKVVTP